MNFPNSPEKTPEEPLNALESKLQALMRGEISNEEFLREFLEADLYIMVNGEPTGGTLGDKQPMVIAMSDTSPRMIAVFSSPTRAAKMLEHFSDYSYPIMVRCQWVLEHIGTHTGVAFNPGCPEGFELAPEGAQQLRDALAEARAQSGE
jgi:hypothetical protein